MAAFVRFPSTFWTTIRERPERARGEVFERYRTPVFHFLLNHGFQEADAQDLTQEVFLRVCREEFLRRADRDKGKFRNLLLAVTRNLIIHRRRDRSRRKEVSLESPELPLEPDPQFDGFWIQTLVTSALQRMKDETPAVGPRHYEALVLRKLQRLSYPAIAEKLGTTVSQVRNWIHHGKKRLQVLLSELVREYSSSEEEWKEELLLVRRHLS